MRSANSILSKFAVRGGISAELSVRDSYTCAYGSKDVSFDVVIRASDPQMPRSETCHTVNLSGCVTVHRAGRWNNPNEFEGSLSIGAGCASGEESIHDPISPDHKERFTSFLHLHAIEPSSEIIEHDISFYYGREIEKETLQGVKEAIFRALQEIAFTNITA